MKVCGSSTWPRASLSECSGRGGRPPLPAPPPPTHPGLSSFASAALCALFPPVGTSPAPFYRHCHSHCSLPGGGGVTRSHPANGHRFGFDSLDRLGLATEQDLADVGARRGEVRALAHALAGRGGGLGCTSLPVPTPAAAIVGGDEAGAVGGEAAGGDAAPPEEAPPPPPPPPPETGAEVGRGPCSAESRISTEAAAGGPLAASTAPEVFGKAGLLAEKESSEVLSGPSAGLPTTSPSPPNAPAPMTEGSGPPFQRDSKPSAFGGARELQ